MKISQAEIDAAWNHAFHSWPESSKGQVRMMLEAALTVRKARKQAKRERQRKEKDKQIEGSVKAPEWDGTFGIGEWKMRNGRKATVLRVKEGVEYPLRGETRLSCWTMQGEWLDADSPCERDLIRPWPKPTEGERS